MIVNEVAQLARRAGEAAHVELVKLEGEHARGFRHSVVKDRTPDGRPRWRVGITFLRRGPPPTDAVWQPVYDVLDQHLEGWSLVDAEQETQDTMSGERLVYEIVDDEAS